MMKGTLLRFNGFTGYLRGEDGKQYFIHAKFISKSLGNTNKVKKALYRLKGEDNAVTFEPINQEAHNITFDITPKGWVPTHDPDNGFWIKEGFLFRCSSCGRTIERQYKFCPYCGVKMDRSKISS